MPGVVHSPGEAWGAWQKNHKLTFQRRPGSLLRLKSNSHHITIWRFYVDSEWLWSGANGDCGRSKIYLLPLQDSIHHGTRVLWSSGNIFPQDRQEGHVLLVELKTTEMFHITYPWILNKSSQTQWLKTTTIIYYLMVPICHDIQRSLDLEFWHSISFRFLVRGSLGLQSVKP